MPIRRNAPCKILSIPQSIAIGEIDSRDALPSFHYQPTSTEQQHGQLTLPWQASSASHTVGTFARDHGAPGFRTDDRIGEELALPFRCRSDIGTSAVAGSRRRAAPVTSRCECRVPATHPRGMESSTPWPRPCRSRHCSDNSRFFRRGRSRTDRSSRQVGWTAACRSDRRTASGRFIHGLIITRTTGNKLSPRGQNILVCDIGGGTSDFTLIKVREGEAGKVQFHRVAVGEHLILGGDNLDLAIAHFIEGKIDAELSSRAWDMLIGIARQLKETFLSDTTTERQTVHLPGGGVEIDRRFTSDRNHSRRNTPSRLGRILSTSMSRRTTPSTRQSGFSTVLDCLMRPIQPSTKYLAKFLSEHGEHGQPVRPDIILFNGGLFAASILQQQLNTVIQSWFQSDDPNWQPVILDNDRLDQAVARGAAYYGMSASRRRVCGSRQVSRGHITWRASRVTSQRRSA